MNTYDDALVRQFDQRLAAREEELCRLLAARDAGAVEPAPGDELHDFKDCDHSQ